MTLGDCFEKLLQDLRQSPADHPLRELRLMAAQILNLTHDQLLFNPPDVIDEQDAQKLQAMVYRRCQHEPLAKILGYKEFWGLTFKVTQDTLDPRPDSETLIETALSYLTNKSETYRILDLGTGSGCLVLSLLSELPAAVGMGVDLSVPALVVAQANAVSLDLDARCQFVQSNWFGSIDGSFDLIITNPPYIDPSEVLSRQTRYDPESALFAGDRGLADYRTIFSTARSHLNDQGLLVLEIGHEQAVDVTKIAQNQSFKLLKLVKDLHGNDRCLVFY